MTVKIWFSNIGLYIGHAKSKIFLEYLLKFHVI